MLCVCVCVIQGNSLVSKGEEIKLHAPLDKINLHLREGSIIPTQVLRVTVHTSAAPVTSAVLVLVLVLMLMILVLMILILVLGIRSVPHSNKCFICSLFHIVCFKLFVWIRFMCASILLYFDLLEECRTE